MATIITIQSEDEVIVNGTTIPPVGIPPEPPTEPTTYPRIQGYHTYGKHGGDSQYDVTVGDVAPELPATILDFQKVTGWAYDEIPDGATVNFRWDQDEDVALYFPDGGGRKLAFRVTGNKALTESCKMLVVEDGKITDEVGYMRGATHTSYQMKFPRARECYVILSSNNDGVQEEGCAFQAVCVEWGD